MRFALILLLFATPRLFAGGQYLEVTYPPSSEKGELVFGVTYTVWIPDGVDRLRGVIVHQHGCGSGACKGGATAAYDLHWQALAKKWDCALLGPSYHQEDGQNCRLWCDPRNGSAKTFLRCLTDLGTKSKHTELATVPWCLWGHSGGGFWSSLMQTMYPERIVAIWFRSGTAFSAWEKGEIAKPTIPEAAYRIPMMCNPGAKEKGDKRFNGAWTGSLAMFQSYRAQGAPIGFVPDPRTSHECGDCRYLAIRFFDSCLEMRLPLQGSRNQRLRPVDMSAAWFAPVHGDAPRPSSGAKDASDPGVIWLPNETYAKAWAEYNKTGSVSDTTPPPSPVNLKAARTKDGVLLSWDCDADFESGIRGFVVERDGKTLAQLPAKAVARIVRPLFQGLSYHDTPDNPVPEMRFVDSSPVPDAVYRVIALNSVGLSSAPSSVAKTP